MASVLAAKKTSTSQTRTELIEKQHVLLKRQLPPKEKLRLDYQPCAYGIESVDLDFKLEAEETMVECTLTMNKTTLGETVDLRLDGENLEMQWIKVDGRELEEGKDFEFGSDDDPHSIVIKKSCLPQHFTVDTRFVVHSLVKIWPSMNSLLSGLYNSRGILCTQCEAEGFRRITYFLDRPDVMSIYKVRLEADKALYPVLLSNGNKTQSGTLGEQRHFAVYEDPFKKPAYLFALVAGQLDHIHDTFTTADGVCVDLFIWSSPQDCQKLQWSMSAIKKAMKWDEDRFGRIYDLNIFNIVAISDFNMGAMENKSLNIFNTACLLASKEISGDADFERVLGVVGHEYFHNWTGDRVTCRDWFQLTLKEGLTVYRDQEFSRDMTSPAVRRIEDIGYVRSIQFTEDAGPMSHPIRPESYIVMDNFYTTTVYNKGAEVIRMYESILGVDGFRKGMDLYFKRHDGQAVTCDDFRSAMADANSTDLTQFENWYLQKGTPTLRVTERKYDAQNKQYVVEFEQVLPKHSVEKDKVVKPYHIPIQIGLIGKESHKDLIVEQRHGVEINTKVLNMLDMKQRFVIDNISEDCVPSILRNWSAPVKMSSYLESEELSFLMSYDTDPVNKWEAGEIFMKTVVRQHIDAIKSVSPSPTITASPLLINMESLSKITTPSDDLLLEVFNKNLNSAAQTEDKQFLAYCLILPTIKSILNDMKPKEPTVVFMALESIKLKLSSKLWNKWLSTYEHCKNQLEEIEKDTGFVMDNTSTGLRRLKNVCLRYLSVDKDNAEVHARVSSHYNSATCMSDKEAAFGTAVQLNDSAHRTEIIARFLEEGKKEALVIDKWFRNQALCTRVDGFEIIKTLSNHPLYKDNHNPGRLRSLVGAMCANLPVLHRADGGAYKFISQKILEWDKTNPMIASGLFSQSLMDFEKYEDSLKALMKEQVQFIISQKPISPSLYELVAKSLK